MQQQFQADPDNSRLPLPAYSPRYGAAKRSQHEKQISPWGSNEETKKVFNPSQYYETINNELRQTQNHQRHKSSSFWGRDQAFKNRMSNEIGPYLRAKKDSSSGPHEENPYKLNLVTVNLDEEVMQSPQKRYGKTLDNFRPGKSIEMPKEQPVRVRIFKKIQQKNQQAEDEYTERASEFVQEYQGQQPNPFLSIDSNNVFQSMPRRTPRVVYQRSKVHSTLQTANHGFFPKISTEKQKSKIFPSIENGQFFCKGQIITSSKQVTSMRRMNYRSSQLSGERQNQEQSLLFLKKFSYQK